MGWLEVVGEVENRGSISSAYTRVAGTFYDADGKVVYVHFTYTDPSEIPPGAKHPFKITVGSDDRTSRITRYALTAESENSGYTSIPEMPWPTVLTVVALTLVVVVLRTKQRSEYVTLDCPHVNCLFGDLSHAPDGGPRQGW
jgi:hypothetical protein